MANVRKRISELTPLASASLDTTIVGVDNGTTYKIELEVLADAVTSRVNTLDRSRLSSLELTTSSINSFTQSIDNRVDDLESWSSSLGDTFATDLEVSIVSSSVAATIGIISQNTGLVTTSSFNQYTASQSTGSLITSITNLNSATSSYETKGNGVVSGSSQLTSSYDERYVLSGSITQTTWDNIANKPNDIVSSSQQISDLGFVTGSYTTINEFNNLTQSFNIISGSVVNITNAVDVTQLNNTTASLNLFTASISTGSLVTSINNLNTFTASVTTASLVNSINVLNLFTQSAGHSINLLNDFSQSFYTYSASVNEIKDDGILLGYSTRFNFRGNLLSASVTPNVNGLITNIDIVLPAGTISGSAQITAFGFVSGSYETTGRGIISSSANLVTTSSFNTFTSSAVTSDSIDIIQTITSASYAALTPVSGTLYIIIG